MLMKNEEAIETLKSILTVDGKGKKYKLSAFRNLIQNKSKEELLEMLNQLDKQE